jgi:hypothetical protein
VLHSAYSVFPYIGETFATTDMLAVVRLLTRVGSNMNCQSTPLDEALAATWSHARIWSLVRMNSIMSLKIRLPVETLLDHQLVIQLRCPSGTHLVACLPVTLKWSCIGFVLYELHDVHSVTSLSCVLSSGNA